MAATESAVYVRNAYKHYGPKSGPKHKTVLEGLNMTVQRGTIYGLLGASGCGKTTLLSCIVGRRRFNSGDIWVLGGTPGTEGSGVPGPRIGYMPQEIALVGEFSIRGVIEYFGRVVGMSALQISKRFRELSELLDLPPDDRKVGDCSGGQQRRVSLAAALVHDPELVIMDEPTVGVDPVLREKIWEYLVDITAKQNMSVIITTHYIEECRQAHKIGLMRGGRLMAEESPAALIIQYRAETLEEVFLGLSIRQSEGVLDESDNSNNRYTSIPLGSMNTLSGDSVASISMGNNGSTDVLTDIPQTKKRKKISPYTVNFDRLRALFYKNWYQFYKNTSGVMFMILFPLIHMTVFFLAIGGDPIDIPLAFVNHENGTCENFKMNDSLIFLNETDCEFQQMSCRFIREVEDPMIEKKFYTDLDEAMRDTENGKVQGVVYFAKNFSKSTIERTNDGRYASNITLDFSEIKVWLDMSNHQIGPPIKGKLLKKYVEFTKAMFKECGKNPKLGEVPMRFNETIFGDSEYSYTFFMVPGLSITVLYFLAAMNTSAIIINDRLEGVWDRTLVAGASTMEVLIAHVSMQTLMITIQTIEIMILCFSIFQVENKGSYIDIFAIYITQGMAGMCYGFLVSALVSSHMMANFVATGSFYPMLMISGVVWPVEGMPDVLEFVSRNLPFTMPIEALRSILAKGWGSTDTQIIHAYGITIAWVIFYLLFTFYLLKRQM